MRTISSALLTKRGVITAIVGTGRSGEAVTGVGWKKDLLFC